MIRPCASMAMYAWLALSMISRVCSSLARSASSASFWAEMSIMKPR